MTGASIIPRRLIILAIVLPLAALMGYMLATPDDFRTVGMVGMVAGLISIPLILRWQHAVLVFSWNSGIVISLLPGNPSLWMMMAFVSLVVVIVNTGMDRTIKLNHVPGLTWSVVALALVILVTAQLNGGMAIRTMGGSSYGGRKYFLILFAMIGFFALSLQRIGLDKAAAYSGLYLLSRLTLIVSNLAFYVPAFWFLYYFLPTDFAMNQVLEGVSGLSTETSGGRYTGIGFGLMACSSYLLMRWGVQGTLDPSRWWRFLLYLAIVGLSLIGGFRAVLIIQLLLFFVMYTLEGLLRTRWSLGLLLTALTGMVVLFLASSQLPASFQRSLSFLPIDIDPAVRLDAQMSSDWRLRMWKVLWAEIPQYIWLGKGYVANASDYFFLLDATQRGMADSYELSLLAGDYHSGPLSVIIPFGIWGVLAFGAFLVTTARVLRANYRYGQPELLRINRFLLAAYWTDLIFFLFVFGDFTSDFQRFAGYAALSVALNSGMAKKDSEALVRPRIREDRTETSAFSISQNRGIRFRG